MTTKQVDELFSPEVEKRVKKFHKELRETWDKSDQFKVGKSEQAGYKNLLIGNKTYGLMLDFTIVDSDTLLCERVNIVGTMYPLSYLEKALKYIFGLAKLLQMKKVVLIRAYQDKQQMEFMNKQGFVQSWRDSDEEWRENDYVYTMDMLNGQFHTLQDYDLALNAFFRELQPIEPTFKFEFTSAKADCRSYKLYYKGVDSEANLQINEGEVSFTIISPLTESKVPEVEMVQQKVLEVLESAFTKMRLHNTINPPRKCFDEFAKRHLDVGKRNTNQLFEFLSRFYEPLEIETRISQKDYVILEHFEYSEHKLKMTRILDCYAIFVADYDENRFGDNKVIYIPQFFEPSEKDKALDEYEELMMYRHGKILADEIEENFK